MSAADFGISLGSKAGNDQVALFVRDKKAAAVLDQKSIGPSLRPIIGGSRGESLPNASASFGVEASELAVRTDAKNEVPFNGGCADDAVQVFGIFFARLLCLPDRRRWH